MQLNVTQHNPNVPSHIEEIRLVHENADIIVLEVNLRNKRIQVDAYGGDCFWVGTTEVQMLLPPSFVDNCTIFSETARYTAYVCVVRFNRDLTLWTNSNDS